GSFDVTPEPAVHEMKVSLLPGEQICPDAARLFRSRPGFTGSPDATEEGMPGIAYRWLEVDGPIKDAASREGYRRLFGDPAAAARAPARLLRHSGAPASPRPPAEPEVQRYLKIINNRLGAGSRGDFTEALIAGYIAVLCSPGFLYLEEQPGALDSYALASRLS